MTTTDAARLRPIEVQLPSPDRLGHDRHGEALTVPATGLLLPHRVPAAVMMPEGLGVSALLELGEFGHNFSEGDVIVQPAGGLPHEHAEVLRLMRRAPEEYGEQVFYAQPAHDPRTRFEDQAEGRERHETAKREQARAREEREERELNKRLEELGLSVDGGIYERRERLWAATRDQRQQERLEEFHGLVADMSEERWRQFTGALGKLGEGL